MTETEQRLVAALAAEARGPRRNGIFAVWLFARVAEDVLPPDAVTPRSHRGRVDALQRRLSSIALPAPLRRALAGSLRQVMDGTPRAAATALSQLVAPAQETLGAAASEVLAQAALKARRAADGKVE
jgi:hypothetical protein